MGLLIHVAVEGLAHIMNRVSLKLMHTWVGLGSRFLPFADVATPDLPLGRLLRLSMFQVTVGMALVLLVGTLNRVMIVELDVPASLVGVMISLPLLFAPFRALIGFKSDVHQSALGWRRVPFIFRGTMVQFGGLAIMPFALLVLSGGGESARFPIWVGHIGAGVAFRDRARRRITGRVFGRRSEGSCLLCRAIFRNQTHHQDVPDRSVRIRRATWRRRPRVDEDRGDRLATGQWHWIGLS